MLASATSRRGRAEQVDGRCVGCAGACGARGPDDDLGPDPVGGASSSGGGHTASGLDETACKATPPIGCLSPSVKGRRSSRSPASRVLLLRRARLGVFRTFGFRESQQGGRTRVRGAANVASKRRKGGVGGGGGGGGIRRIGPCAAYVRSLGDESVHAGSGDGRDGKDATGRGRSKYFYAPCHPAPVSAQQTPSTPPQARADGVVRERCQQLARPAERAYRRERVEARLHRTHLASCMPIISSSS